MYEPGFFATHSSLLHKAAVYLSMLRASASWRAHRLLEQVAKSSPASAVILLYIKKVHSSNKHPRYGLRRQKANISSYPAGPKWTHCIMALAKQGRNPQPPPSILATFGESAALGTSLNIENTPRLLCVFRNRFIPFPSISPTKQFHQTFACRLHPAVATPEVSGWNTFYLFFF